MKLRYLLVKLSSKPCSFRPETQTERYFANNLRNKSTEVLSRS